MPRKPHGAARNRLRKEFRNMNEALVDGKFPLDFESISSYQGLANGSR
jgi:hypothetical protein